MPVAIAPALFTAFRGFRALTWVGGRTPAGTVADVARQYQVLFLTGFELHLKRGSGRHRYMPGSAIVPVLTGRLKESLHITGKRSRSPVLRGVIYGERFSDVYPNSFRDYDNRPAVRMALARSRL